MLKPREVALGHVHLSWLHPLLCRGRELGAWQGQDREPPGSCPPSASAWEDSWEGREEQTLMKAGSWLSWRRSRSSLGDVWAAAEWGQGRCTAGAGPRGTGVPRVSCLLWSRRAGSCGSQGLMPSLWGSESGGGPEGGCCKVRVHVQNQKCTDQSSALKSQAVAGSHPACPPPDHTLSLTPSHPGLCAAPPHSGSSLQVQGDTAAPALGASYLGGS